MHLFCATGERDSLDKVRSDLHNSRPIPVKHSITLIALSLCLQLPAAWCQNAPNLFATKRFKIEFTRGDMLVNRGGEITERKELGNPSPHNPMVLLITGERTAQLQDNP